MKRYWRDRYDYEHQYWSDRWMNYQSELDVYKRQALEKPWLVSQHILHKPIPPDTPVPEDVGYGAGSIEKIMRYFNVEPYYQSMMINISPAWKGEIQDDEHLLVRKFLKTVMSKFYDTKFFTRMKYVIECGGEGNFPHIHAVFEFNPKYESQYRGWVKKSNHLRDLRACWNKVCASGAPQWKDKIASKYAIQSNLLNTKQVRDDKLNYLVEDLKPPSHQNAEHPQYPHIVNEGFEGLQ